MTTYGNYPTNYLLFNSQQSKQLAIIMKIEGVSDLFGISDTYTTVRYGDLGLVYGTPGLVYGGLRKVGGANGVGAVKSYIMLEGGMTIQQRIEPEQGRGNIGTLAMTLIDKNGEISYLIAPGNVVDEIMTSKQVTIYIGFQQTSFPEDYVILFRGYITQLDCPPGIVRFQLSDGTMKSRQPVFNTPSTYTTTALDATQTSIPVINTSGFHTPILGPDGNYDSIVKTFIVIDSEIMEYGTTGIVDGTHFSVTRGSLGTLADVHDNDAQVMNSIQLGQNTEGGGVNFITLALKMLLSGWNGPCETNIALLSLGYIDYSSASPVTDLAAFVLSSDDAVLDLGLTAGDYFSISGSVIAGNNLSGVITDLGVLNSNTVIIYTDQTFDTYETPTQGVAAFRSKYDTLPVTAGSKCRMRDVDVETMEAVRSAYFTSSIYQVSIYYDAPDFAKDLIASDLFLPMGCYQISRYGRISISVTKPPLPGATGKLVELNSSNVLMPQNIVVNRSTNNRTFYNQISYEYDYDVATQTFTSIQYFIDTQSLSKFDQVLTLPIQAKGLTTTLGGGNVAQIRGAALLTRYKNVALMITLTVNWSVGSLIEVSDIVLLNDNGELNIMNFQTGVRNLGAQLFEVIDRSYNVTQGNVTLKLLGGLGFNQNSRFGLISPSTILTTGSTASLLRLTPSYGQTSISNELGKWSPFFGLPIMVHSADYSVTGTSTLVGVSATDMTALDIDPPLGFTPSAGYILEIANYPTDTNANTNAKYKALYAYINPVVAVASGISSTQFTVDAGDISKFVVGNSLIVRTERWTVYSQEVTISTVDTGTNTITVSEALTDQLTDSPFTPDSSYFVDGIGYLDDTGYYRFD